MKRSNFISATKELSPIIDGRQILIRKHRVQAFIKAYKNEFKEELSFKEANDMMLRLVQLYLLLASPIPAGSEP